MTNPPAPGTNAPASPVPPTRRRSLRRVARLLALLLAVSLVTIALLAWLMPERILTPVAAYLDVSEPPHAVDYVLVLNGDPETRPFAAAALVHAGLAKKILLTHQQLALESNHVQSGGTLSEFELTRQVLLARGVPAPEIQVLPGEIGSSYDELEKFAGFLTEHPEATATVVTNGFHTRRSRWVLRRLLGDRANAISFVGVPRDGVDAAKWWRSKTGCAIYLTEYPKVLYYWARY